MAAILARVITALVLLTLVVLLILLVVVPRAAGWVPLTVLSGSMEPAIPAGAQVVVQPLETEANLVEVEVGDVITFMPYPDSDTLVTHRVVAVGFQADGAVSLTTRGDANRVDDPQPVTVDQARGLVRYHVPYAGHLAGAISAQYKQIGIVVGAALLFGYAAVQVAGIARSRHRDTAEAEPGAGGSTEEWDQ